MAPKRKTRGTFCHDDSINVTCSEKKSRSAAHPTTMRGRVLAIVAESDELVGLPTLKKKLKNQYGMEDSKAFNTLLNKTLRTMCEENRDDFGKIGGSYHAGPNSTAFLIHQEKEKSRAIMEKHRADGEIDCPHCQFWCGPNCFLREDSVARGGLHECESCGKHFWSWISDGYTRGHTKEYRYGDPMGIADYKGLR